MTGVSTSASIASTDRSGTSSSIDDQKLLGNYLRVGWDPDGSWRIYKLRPDFNPADKVQVEDDITASVVLARERFTNLDPEYLNPSFKLVQNCETLLFQRPDDAIHRGFDAQAEADMASPGTFISNFEPLTREQARKMVDHVAEFDQYTAPMKKLLTSFVTEPAADNLAYVVSSAHPRLVDGSPSKNPRYLQKRPDLVNPRETHLAEMGTRLDREFPSDRKMWFPVNAVLPGRRNNPPDPKIGVPPLAVYNPIHYQELPELFMDFICSLTGKSPSTTGFGSEGALTKGPFNALSPVIDVNNALVSAILTGYAGFHHCGRTYRAEVSRGSRQQHAGSGIVVPHASERARAQIPDREWLSRKGGGSRVRRPQSPVEPAGISHHIAICRSLSRPHFRDARRGISRGIAAPEMQDEAAFAQGVDAIVDAQRRVALNYFEDWQHRRRVPADPRAAAHHGLWRVGGQRHRRHVCPLDVHSRVPPRERMVPGAFARQTAQRYRHVAATRSSARSLPP